MLPADVQQLFDDFAEIGLNDDMDDTRRELSTHADDEAAWIEVAANLRERRQYHGADLVYQRALARFPNAYRLWNNRGLLLRVWGRYDAAVNSFRKALELKPDYVLAMENLGGAFEMQQNLPEALHWYEQALAVEPDRIVALNNSANCLHFLGERDEAMRRYEKVLSLEPAFQDALFNLAALYYEVKRYDDALPLIEGLLELVPGDDEAERLRDHILQRPDEPHPTLPAQQPQDWVIRASPNVGYTGTTAGGKTTLAKRDPDAEPIDHPLSMQDIANMDRETAAAEFGYNAWDKAHLWQLVQEGAENTPVPEEPTLFISYRWESDAHIEWVSQFAADLVDRGYEVVFDRYTHDEPNPPTVPELVARLVRCNFFVPILTEGYRRRVELGADAASVIEDGWVFDEYQVALSLAKAGRTKFVGIWRSGPVVPRPFSTDDVLDFRRDEDYLMLMDQTFPMRYVFVVGMRPDQTGRSIGPVKRSEADQYVEMLQATGEFIYIALMAQ